MCHVLGEQTIRQFVDHLYYEERKKSTILKYERDVWSFYAFLPENGEFDKRTVLQWKETIAKQYSVSTVNAKLAAVNGLFSVHGWNDCRVKPLKQQKKIFREKEKELTKKEYLRLLNTAREKGNERLYLLMETLCSTGMRVSEVKYVTVGSLRAGCAVVDCKGKQRTVILPQRLCNDLEKYCIRKGIKCGPIFVTKTGKPVDRSNIWRELQHLCESAAVAPDKVFPHNFRHLFAVSFYELEKDIAKLADLLGHASIETTRIYIMESGAEHQRQLERLGLVI